MINYRKGVLPVALVFWVLHPGFSLGAEGESHRGYESAVVIEAETGRTLFEDRSHIPRRPASTVKTMLELIVMERVREGRVSLDDSVVASAKASKIGGSQVFLKEGEVFTLRDLMKAIVIHSANDACTSVAEHLDGSEERFVASMNRRAEELGLEGHPFCERTRSGCGRRSRVLGPGSCTAFPRTYRIPQDPGVVIQVEGFIPGRPIYPEEQEPACRGISRPGRVEDGLYEASGILSGGDGRAR